MWLRRRWCPRGARPPRVVDDRSEWPWLYAADEPASGASFVLLRPGGSKAWVGLFLREFGRAVAGRRGGVAPDGAGGHRAGGAWPLGGVPRSLPPYSPAPNPAAQGCRRLRAKLANRGVADVAGLAAALAEHLRVFWERPATPRRLTAYPRWLRGLAATMPSAP